MFFSAWSLSSMFPFSLLIYYYMRSKKAKQKDGRARFLNQRATKSVPGTKYDHRNSGYGLLGLTVAGVSGKPFRDFGRNRVFVPHKMGHRAVLDDRLYPGRAGF